jgi:hypothetical protein
VEAEAGTYLRRCGDREFAAAVVVSAWGAIPSGYRKMDEAATANVPKKKAPLARGQVCFLGENIQQRTTGM